MPFTTALHKFSLALPIGASGVPEQDRRELRLALALIFAYLVASITYGLIAKAPWDDDCVVRYFNTIRAWHDPSQFFSLWNRPLFVLLFAPAAQLGQTAMMLQMTVISAASGWALFLALRHVGTPRAWMVLPLFFFQNYYFSISRDNLTEPLAVAIICFGLYALVTRRWLLFAFLGGLLPLARLEISVVLPLWALVLLWEKQWKAIILLGVPTLVLMVGGWLIRDHGGLLWLVNETVGAGNDTNRYGHRDLWHYFLRFGFVTGPVVFLFFFTGLAERLARWRVDLFIIAQLLLIFTLYVLFSWKLNMGNAAGFLRNLIPLTPFIAVLALDGFNAWMRALAPVENNAAIIPVSVEAPPGKHRKGRAAQHAPSRSKQEKAHEKEKVRHRWLTLRVVLFSLLALWISHHFYSWMLRSHQTIETRPDHEPEIVTAAVVAALLGLLLLSRRLTLPRWCFGCFQVAIIATAIASTLLSETPDSHLNPERETLNEISTLFRDGKMQDAPLYVNHIWFFWPHDLGYPADRYRTLTKAAVAAAPAHSRFIWENHYSNRLAGDVQLLDMKQRKDLVELCTAKSRDNRFELVLFQKMDTALHDGPALADAFIISHPDLPYAYITRATRESDTKEHEKAIADVQHLLALDSSYNYARLVAGMVYFKAARYAEAERNFKGAMAMDTVYTSVANQSIGLCRMKQGDEKGAIPWFNAALAKDPKSLPAQGNIALCYYNLKDYKSAMTAYAAVQKLNAREKSAYVGQGNCYYNLKNYNEALTEYDNGLKLAPSDATLIRNKALALVQLGRKQEACAQFQLAASHGDAASSQMLTNYCR